MARARVAILHQGCVPTYRKPFFERLARRSQREYVVFHGNPDPTASVVPAPGPYAFPNRHVSNHFFRVFGRSLAFQSVILPVLFGDYDALVVGHEIKYVSNLILGVLFKLLGRPVILWGHGGTRNLEGADGNRRQTALTRLVEKLKARMILGATGYMAYSSSGADYVERVGMPRNRITVLLNTIDMSDEIAAHERWQQRDREEIRARLGIAPGAIVFIFIGRLIPLKRVGLLAQTIRSLRAEGLPVEALVVGSGPDDAELEREFGGESWCHRLGAVFERERIAELMRAADAVAIPDYVGLAINHAFAHGLPVITMKSKIHGPEIEYLKDQVNGMIPEGEDGFREALKQFATSAELRRRLSGGALRSRDQFDLVNMVKAFDRAISTALDRNAQPPAAV